MLSHQQAGDQEPAKDEEDVHTEESPARMVETQVEEDDRTHSERSQPVERWHVAGPVHPPLGMGPSWHTAAPGGVSGP